MIFGSRCKGLGSSLGLGVAVKVFNNLKFRVQGCKFHLSKVLNTVFQVHGFGVFRS